MSERRFLWVLVGVAMAVLAAAFYAADRARPRRSNLLLVTLDTTRADHLAAYGYPHIETPTLDRMARNGIRYARCYSPAPLTLPAHASLMTGLYPFHHGIHGNGARLDENAVTLAELLREHGYQTGAAVGAFVLDSQFGLDQGFEFYDDDTSDAELHAKFQYAERPAEAVTDAAIAWLERIGDAPFFLWVHYFDPHQPYEPPGYDPATALGAPYDLEISYADAQLDRLLAETGRIGHDTERATLLVFASDHGESLWEHGEPTHGFFAYDDTLHVPLLVFLPSAEQRGVVIDTPVSLVDLFPSILRWLDLPLPHGVHGVPLPTSPRDAAEGPHDGRPVYFESQLPYRSYGWSPLEGVIVGDEKYIAAPEPELYDLDADPDESRNLYTEDDPRALRLKSALRKLKQSKIGAPLLGDSPSQPDPEGARRLEALGYLDMSPSPPADPRGLVDPKQRIALHREVLDAHRMISTGDARGGLEALRGILEAYPDNARVLLLLLDLLAEPEVRSEVAEVLERRMAAPLRAPFDRRLPLFLGIARVAEERWQEAERALAIVLAADPGDPAARLAMAQALLGQGRRKAEVLAHLDQLSRAGFDPENGVLLAELFADVGERERALEVYEAVLERRPDDAIALNDSAWLYYEMRRDSEVALERSGRAVSLQPERPEFLHTYGTILLWAGRASEALPQLAEAVALAPDYAAAYHQLGLAELATRDLDNAAAALARAIELAGDPPPAWLPDARSRLARLRRP